MKTVLGTLFIGLMGITSLQAGEKREFTSADGSKTMKAEFVRYDYAREKVTLRMSNGRNMVAAAKMFSEKDQEYFVQTQKEEDKKTAIKADSKTTSSYEKTPRGQMIWSYRNSTINFEIKNTSDSSFNGLELRYWTVIERDNKGNEKIEVVDGKSKVADLPGDAEDEIVGPTIKLVRGAASNCSCPLVAERAAQIGRDRIIGTKMEIVNSEGEVLYSNSTSNQVDEYISESKS